jgi:ribosome maturation factor RimP
MYQIMANEKNIEKVTEMLLGLLDEHTFLVNIKVKPTNNIKIFIDTDEGVSVQNCIKINRALYKLVEEAALYVDGDFSLEVSSPGLGEPLKLHRQYVKNIGRFVEITLLDGTISEGKLLEVAEDDLKIEFTEGKGKKAVVIQKAIAFADIKQTLIQIKF